MIRALRGPKVRAIKEAAQNARRNGGSTMETALSTRINHARTWSPPLRAAIAAVITVVLVAALVLVTSQANPLVGQAHGALSPQQIVIRGEFADRLAQSASGWLSPQQILIRGEVADRMAMSVGAGLSPQQIVIRGEVADRMATSVDGGQ